MARYSNSYLGSEYQNGKVIFLDETGFKITMRRAKGREYMRKEVTSFEP
jgi:hypothetical protein